MTEDFQELREKISQIIRRADGSYEQVKRLWPYKTLCLEIERATAFLPQTVKLTTRVWYILNDRHELRRCQVCGEVLPYDVNSLNYVPRRVCSSAVCLHELRKRTLLEKYGETYFSDWQNRLSKTNVERYGVANAMDNSTIQQRQLENSRLTVQKNNDSIKRKRIQTLQERYGVDNAGQLPEHIVKMQNTSLQKYGVKSYSSTVLCKQKVSNTWKRKTPEELLLTHIQRQNTCIQRYGVPSASCLPQHQTTRRSRYKYDGLFFDSSYELAYYIWARDTGIQIQRCSESFPYIVENKVHYYIPDFIVNGMITEIKGDHFFNEAGDLINPFSNDPSVQNIYKLKGKLMENMGVTIIRDVTEQLEYVTRVYGDHYLQKYKIIL